MDSTLQWRRHRASMLVVCLLDTCFVYANKRVYHRLKEISSSTVNNFFDEELALGAFDSLIRRSKIKSGKCFTETH